jgi:hypothetical protein
MSKMGLHDPFGYLKHMLWPKKGSGVKIIVKNIASSFMKPDTFMRVFKEPKSTVLFFFLNLNISNTHLILDMTLG